MLPGCGGGGDEGDPIPRRAANRMVDLIERADQQSADGTCKGAQAKVREAQSVLEDQVPSSVDRDVRQGIADGLERMLNLIQTECQKPEETQTQTETTETETIPTVTQTQTQTAPPPTETQTQPTVTQPTTTTPTTQTTTGNGGTPGGQVGGGVGAGEGDG